MKKLITHFCCLAILSSCSILKKEKYGCPTDGRNIGAERLASGDPKTLKKASKAKYRGGRKAVYY